MQRKNITITDEDVKFLNEFAKANGINRSEAVRRLIEKYRQFNRTEETQDIMWENYREHVSEGGNDD